MAVYVTWTMIKVSQASGYTLTYTTAKDRNCEALDCPKHGQPYHRMRVTQRPYARSQTITGATLLCPCISCDHSSLVKSLHLPNIQSLKNSNSVSARTEKAPHLRDGQNTKAGTLNSSQRLNLIIVPIGISFNAFGNAFFCRTSRDHAKAHVMIPGALVGVQRSMALHCSRRAVLQT